MIIATFKLTFLFHNSLRNDKCKKYLMNNQDLPCIYFYFEKNQQNYRLKDYIGKCPLKYESLF
jgi:hypothetical protein